MLFDAHNHLQDPRLTGQLEDILSVCQSEGISKMVVNGTREADWSRVLELAKKHPSVLPSFGFHPWFLKERTAGWQERLLHHLDAAPSAIGEIGLDRWMNDPEIGLQEEMFRWQLRIAAERNIPATIHCLKDWGRLDRILREETRPEKGFLLHSYGGPSEMVDGFVKLGGYFGISGYFAHERKTKQRETFGNIPLNRLLIETDAPDMSPPDTLIRHPLIDRVSKTFINHPANLKSVYDFTATLLNIPVDHLTSQVDTNFNRLFSLDK